MSRNKIPIEKFTSLEIDVGEAIDETLDELQAVDKNWYLTEEEKKILAESNDPEFDFFGLTSSERNIILEKMKQHKTSSEEYLQHVTDALMEITPEYLDKKYGVGFSGISCHNDNDSVVVTAHDRNGCEIFTGSRDEHKLWLDNLNNDEILEFGIKNQPWNFKYPLPEEVLNGSRMHPLWE